MTIELNGERVELADGTLLSTAVQRVGASPDQRGVAVAVEGEVIPRSSWQTTELREGQRVEVVGAIQGG